MRVTSKVILGIWAQCFFKHAFKHFYGINTTKLYLFHLHKVHKIKPDFRHFTSLFQFTALKADFFHFLFWETSGSCITELVKFKMSLMWLLYLSVKYFELLKCYISALNTYLEFVENYFVYLAWLWVPSGQGECYSFLNY